MTRSMIGVMISQVLFIIVCDLGHDFPFLRLIFPLWEVVSGSKHWWFSNFGSQSSGSSDFTQLDRTGIPKLVKWINNKNNKSKNTERKDILFIEHLGCTTAHCSFTVLSPTLSIHYSIHSSKQSSWCRFHPTSAEISDQRTWDGW